VILLFTIAPQTALAVGEPTDLRQSQLEITPRDHERPAGEAGQFKRDERRVLVHTQGEPVGAQHFDDGLYRNPNENVEIAVQFVTPSAVALRLLHEEAYPHIRPLSEETFEARAREGHGAFAAQLASLQPSGLSRMGGDVEIFSEHYSLFNGVFMRVPAGLIEQIVALPEVFSVTPNARISAPEPIEYDDLPTWAGDDFMRESLALFNVPYIHNTLGLTGAGVRVAVLDTGVDYNHPRLAPYRDPVSGRIRGENFTTDDPNDIMDIHGHGTHVTGTVIALAPAIELWHYKVLADDGWGTLEWGVSAVEAAHRDGMDVINLSFGANVGGDLFSPMCVAVNLAALDGIVVVAAAGNNGPWPQSIDSPALASLSIAVANGTAGGHNDYGDVVSEESSRGPVPHIHHIKPDITAPGEGIVSTVPGGGYALSSGTSMAAPHIAGVAALLVEARPTAPPYEIKARLMNTARPLADVGEWEHLSENSVFSIGAGFVQPIQALTGTAFATVRHEIPWLDGGNRTWREETMASLSFGNIIDRAVSDPITVTIHNPGSGTWVPEVQFHADGETWASLDMIRSDTGGGIRTFTYQLRIGETFWFGNFEGNIIFTNGNQRITLPFAGQFVPAIHDIALTPWPLTNPWWPDEPMDDYDFGRAVVGYSPHRARGFQVINTGNVPTGALTVTLSGPGANAFSLSQTTVPSLDLWDGAVVSVSPRTGLAVGVYEATVTVSGGAELHPLYFDVRFQVDESAVSSMELDVDGMLDLGMSRVDASWSVGQRVVISNTGNQPTGGITLSFAGTHADHFYFGVVEDFNFDWHPSQAELPNLESSQMVEFFVSPHFYLPLGIYSAIVTVSAANANIPAQSFDVRFQVVPYNVMEVVSGADHSFGVVPPGYRPRYHTVLLITPRGMIFDLPVAIALTGSNPGAFELGHEEIHGLGFWEETFPLDIRTREGLPEGVYTATVEITGPDGIFVSFGLRLRVQYANPFTDIQPYQWFYDDVRFAYLNDIMTGTSETRFDPEQTLSRAMMAAVLHRMEGSPHLWQPASFIDVHEGDWYREAVTWAATVGIVEGLGDGRFAPNAPITREEMATMLYRYAQWRGYDVSVPGNFGLSGFPDRGQVNNWAYEAMRWTAFHELVRGDADGRLAPRDTATRAECATILYRFVDRFGWGWG